MTLLGEEMQSVVPCYHSDVKLKILLGNCMAKPTFEKKNMVILEIKLAMIESKMIALPEDHEASLLIVGQNLNS